MIFETFIRCVVVDSQEKVQVKGLVIGRTRNWMGTLPSGQEARIDSVTLPCDDASCLVGPAFPGREMTLA